MDESSYTNVLIEDMNGRFDAIMEYVRDIPEMKTRLTGVEDRLIGVEEKLSNVEDRLTGVEYRLTGVEFRVTGVESRLNSVEDQLIDVHEEQRLTRHAIIEELGDVERLKKIHPKFMHS